MSNSAVGRAEAISETPTSWRWLRIGFWACIVIAVAVVLRRTIALAHPCICFACRSDVGAYSSSIGFCPADSVCLHSPVRRCGVAQTPSVPARIGSGHYRLCDDQVFRRGLGGTLCRSVFQQSLSILAISGMATESRAGALLAMADTGNCSPSRHRNDPSRDGNILRHQ